MGQTKMHDSQRQQSANTPQSNTLQSDSTKRDDADVTQPHPLTRAANDSIRRVIASHVDGVNYTHHT